MHIAAVKYCDIANGPGVRTSVFVSGCTHHCEGCFNAVAWDFAYGESMTEELIDQVVESCTPHYIAGLSLLGGEPMEPENQPEVLRLVKAVRAACPGKNVWCYSGYTWEQLTGREPARCRTEVTDELLGLVDVLVDGKFILARKDVGLRFRGSDNQRLLDVPRSLAAGTPVEWTDDPLFASHSLGGPGHHREQEKPMG